MLLQTVMNQNNSALLFVKKYQNAFAFAAIGIFALTLLRSAFYGISSPDESFYLTIPYRLILGDSLIVDEWHASQFSAFLLYLPMKIFMMITKGTEGMILFFRCLFVLCQTAVSAFTFCKMKKYGTLPALVSAVLYMLYVPETVNMLDYYTMSLMGFQVVALTLFCTERLRIPHLLFAGIVFACAVVAQPFNSLVYFIYCIAVLIFAVTKNKKEQSEFKTKYLCAKSWFFITIGIAAVAAVFLAFLFSQLTLAELIENFGNVFGGHDHTLPFAETGATDMFGYFKIFETLCYITPEGIMLSAALIVALCADKNRLERRNLWLLISGAVIIFIVIQYCISFSSDFRAILFKPYISFILTFVCLMLAKKKNKALFAIWATGIAYTVFLGIISQALDYIGVIGLVISNCALMPALFQLCSEMRPKQREDGKKSAKSPLVTVLCVVSAVVICFDAATGIGIKFIDDTMAIGMGRDVVKSDTVIDKGPLKNIRTDSETAEGYYAILSDMEKIKADSCERVLIAGLIPWTYFCFEEAPAAFTTWYIEEEFNLYDEYFKNEDKIPQCIYVPKTSFYWGKDYSEKSEAHRAFFSEMFSAEQTEGSAGYIMYPQ